MFIYVGQPAPAILVAVAEPMDLKCLHGAQLAYTTAPGYSGMPRFLVVPPTSLLSSHLSVTLRHTIYVREFFDRRERERIERERCEREEQEERDDLRRAYHAYLIMWGFMSFILMFLLAMYWPSLS